MSAGLFSAALPAVLPENGRAGPAGLEVLGSDHEAEALQVRRRAVSATRRPPGTGSLLVRRDKAGLETWHGKWRVGERQVMRKIGLRREPGSALGLTRSQAEAELRRLIAEDTGAVSEERLNLEGLAGRFLAHKETLGLRKSTLNDYEGMLRVHLVPFFGGRSLERITPVEVESYIQVKLRDGKARKTVDHHLGLLSSVFRFAVKRGYARTNPVDAAERPRYRKLDADIRYLTIEELEAVLRHAPDDALGPAERVLYLTAAMTGMRRGELVALRWRDVDWASAVIRVRRSYGDGEFGPPKSRRSSRAVPMADRVAQELEHLYSRSSFQGEEDLVFCHPELGTVYDPSKLRKRFTAACTRAGVRPARFHDLRHTFGTQMAAAGAPMRAVQEWMGHSDYRTTSIYSDYAPDPSQGAYYAAKAFGTGERASPQSLEAVLSARARARRQGRRGLLARAPVTRLSKIGDCRWRSSPRSKSAPAPAARHSAWRKPASPTSPSSSSTHWHAKHCAQTGQPGTQSWTTSRSGTPPATAARSTCSPVAFPARRSPRPAASSAQATSATCSRQRCA